MPPTKFQSPERVVKSPLIGKGGSNDKVEGDELFDVRPMTVGLVERGANRLSFFLAKSDGGKSMANNMLDDLDATLTSLEQAAKDEEDEDELEEDPGAEVAEEPTGEEPEPPADGKKKPSALVKAFGEAILLVANRRARDPMLAAQRALGNVGSHPELMDCAKFLMDYIQAHGGTTPKSTGAAEDKPAPRKPSPVPPGSAEPGDHSVANSVEEGGTVAGSNPAELQAALATALEPLMKRLDEVEEGNKELKKSLTANQDAQLEAAVVPLAKSMNIKPSTVIALQKSMDPKEFEALSTQINRAQRVAAQAGFFSELGTSLGDEQGEDLSNEVLLQKSAEKLVKDSEGKLPFGDALIQASVDLGYGLRPARSFNGGQ